MLLFALALATELEPSPQASHAAQGGVELVEQRYARLDGDEHSQAHPRWRRKSSGDFRVWQRPDGTVQRAHTLSRGHVVLDRVYDLLGYPSVSVTWADEVPTEATVHLAEVVTLSLEDWAPQHLEGVDLYAPRAPNGDTLSAGAGTLTLWTETPTDVTTDTFRDEVADGCGCRVIERTAAWVDGAPGVRLRLQAPATGHGDAIDLWAVPRDTSTWVAAYQVPASEDPDRDLATGRVLVAMMRWAPEAAAPPEAD